MSNNVGPKITWQDGKWFLTGISDRYPVKVELPNNPMISRIWDACSNLLDFYIDYYGANQDRHVEVLRNASKAFAGISELLADEAKSLQNEIELEELYAPDENEPWYNK